MARLMRDAIIAWRSYAVERREKAIGFAEPFFLILSSALPSGR
jgi:hypothetical protein